MFKKKIKSLFIIILVFSLLGCGGEDQNGECVPEGKEIYRGSVLLVIQDGSEIIAKNISNQPVAIRISWDGDDPYGTGLGDSFIDNWVEPKSCISQAIKNHTSVQVWAWGESGGLIDSCKKFISSLLKPNKLLIFYGWPSCINQTNTIAGAAREFGKYKYIVLGDMLEKFTHPDHQNTVNIISHLYMEDTVVFGYIDLGVINGGQNLSMEEIRLRIDEWKETGADGIFFDDFGYDFGTSRERQNQAVQYSHHKEMMVVANAFKPEDAFDDRIDPNHNPLGASTLLDSRDYYLYESHQIRLCEFASEENWQKKAQKINIFKDEFGFKVFSITTSNPNESCFDEDKFFYSWYSALIYGHEATGWGEKEFGAIDCISPYQARPNISPGTYYTSDIIDESPVYRRITNLGEILINTATHEYDFFPVE